MKMNVEWEKLLNEVVSKSGSMSNTYCRFYNYSFLNTIYLRMQGINEPVATYNKWQTLGRQVRKGTKAKFVLAPMTRKDDNGDTKVYGYRISNSIFAYSDTDGPELSLDIPVWDKDKALTELGINIIPFNSLRGNSQGYAIDKNIAINPVAKHPRKTMFHEIAHIILEHTEDEDTDRGIKEFQAETTAHIVMNELELDFDPSESRAYVQNWLNNNKPKEEEIQQVFFAVNTILKAGRKLENV